MGVQKASEKRKRCSENLKFSLPMKEMALVGQGQNVCIICVF